jgi:uncharacterized protein (DUF39 family)
MEIFHLATNSNKAIKATSTLVLARNPARNYAAFVNDSDTVMYLALGAAAVKNKGIRLNANGGSLEFTAVNLYKGPVYAIHAGAGDKILCFVEGE